MAKREAGTLQSLDLSTKQGYKDLIRKKEIYINRSLGPKPSDKPATVADAISWYIQQNDETLQWRGTGAPLELLPNQALLPNLVNPLSDIKEMLVFQEPGVGKTCTAVQIAETFRPYAIAHNSNILIVAQSGAQEEFVKSLSGPCTNFEWISPEKLIQIQKLAEINTQKSREKIEKIEHEIEKSMSDKRKGGMYKFITYMGLTNMVASDPIDMTNGLIIVDEAHNIEDNEIGKALRLLIDRATNVRIVLLTATPMRHGPEEIVEIMNFLVPQRDRVNIRDIFRRETVSSIGLDRVIHVPMPNAESVIKKLAKGRVSFLRSFNPYLFPKKIEMGDNLPQRSCPTVKVVKVPMSSLQYLTITSTDADSNLHFQSKKQMSNMVFPSPPELQKRFPYGVFTSTDLDKLSKASRGWLEEQGIRTIRTKEGILTFGGDFLKRENLPKYSPKFARLLDDLDTKVMKAPYINDQRLFPLNNRDMELGKSMIYIEDIRGIGLVLLASIMQENGYVQSWGHNEVGKPNTKCFRCGVRMKDHNPVTNDAACGKFGPARFIIVSGQHGNIDQRVKLISMFNQPSNWDGSSIKIILGSKVVQESINLKDVTSMFIMNYQFDFATLVQIIGRAVRTGSHENIDDLSKRVVKIYKYASVFPTWQEIKALSLPSPSKLMSPEEEEYCIGEKVHHYIKQIERWLKQVALDCSINRPTNIQKVEVDANKKCVPVLAYIEDKDGKWKGVKAKDVEFCPQDCDYQSCSYECFQQFPQKELKLTDLDISTYSHKDLEKEMNAFIPYIIAAFRETPVWSLVALEQDIRSKVPPKFELFDENTFYRTLSHMISDRIMFSRSPILDGYITEKGDYIVFQPEQSDDNIPISLRYTPNLDVNRTQSVPLKSLLMSSAAKKDNQEENLESMRRLTILAMKAPSQEMCDYYLARLDIGLSFRLLRRAIEMSQPRQTKETKTNDIPLFMQRVLSYFAPILVYDGKNVIGYKKIVKGDDGSGRMNSDLSSCYRGGEWTTCSKYDVHPIYVTTTENKEIVGYLEMVSGEDYSFKVRPGSGAMVDAPLTKSDKVDKRKLQRGIVCRTMKRPIMEAMYKQYVAPGMSNADSRKEMASVTARNICMQIEVALRKREQEARQLAMRKFTETNKISSSSKHTSSSDKPLLNRWFLEPYE